MSQLSVRFKLGAFLISVILAASIAMVPASYENAYAHNDESSHHSTQAVTKPGKCHASIISCTKKSCTVKWNGVKGATSYQVKCIPRSGGKTVTKTVGKSVRRTTVSGLKSGTTYNVRVRACKTVNGSKKYGNWSTRCTAKVKSASSHHTTTNSSCVYITNSGSKFHASGCRSLRASKFSISRSSALSQGYTACKICHP